MRVPLLPQEVLNMKLKSKISKFVYILFVSTFAFSKPTVASYCLNEKETDAVFYQLDLLQETIWAQGCDLYFKKNNDSKYYLTIWFNVMKENENWREVHIKPYLNKDEIKYLSEVHLEIFTKLVSESLNQSICNTKEEFWTFIKSSKYSFDIWMNDTLNIARKDAEYVKSVCRYLNE